MGSVQSCHGQLAASLQSPYATMSLNQTIKKAWTVFILNMGFVSKRSYAGTLGLRCKQQCHPNDNLDPQRVIFEVHTIEIKLLQEDALQDKTRQKLVIY